MSLHPMIESGFQKGTGSFAGGKLHCHCPSDKVEVTITGDVAHNHACGCSKCWKPKGAEFSIVAVVPTDHLKVTAHEEKLHIVDPSATIQRHACKQCGVHMFGRIVTEHPFKGLDFVHVELVGREGLAGAAVRGLRLLDHRAGPRSKRHGQRALEAEVGWPRGL